MYDATPVADLRWVSLEHRRDERSRVLQSAPESSPRSALVQEALTPRSSPDLGVLGQPPLPQNAARAPNALARGEKGLGEPLATLAKGVF